MLTGAFTGAALRLPRSWAWAGARGSASQPRWLSPRSTSCSAAAFVGQHNLGIHDAVPAPAASCRRRHLSSATLMHQVVGVSYGRSVPLCSPLESASRYSTRRLLAAMPGGGTSGDMPGIHVEVAVDVEGDLSEALPGSGIFSVDEFAAMVEADAMTAAEEAIRMDSHVLSQHSGAELSILLCDDSYIAKLNLEWREKDGPTDVLSFPGFDDQPPGYPLKVLGDIIISLDTAAAQAEERGYTLQEEVRVLLVHGIFHLLGYDHELGEKEMLEMAEREVECFKQLGWQGEGLIARCEGGANSLNLHGEQAPLVGSSVTSSSDSSEMFVVPGAENIKLLAIDMDGTLLNSSSEVTARTARALKAAMDSGVQVILATGKARPAAISAMESVNLAGTGLVVGKDQPGVFLQGLAVYGKSGKLLQSDNLPAPVVLLCFEHAYENDIPICAFLGDECVTIKMTPELEQLHHTYYEPLAKVVGGMADIFGGPPVKKILFMTDPEYVRDELLPFLDEELEDSGAQTCQAVPNMLEVVPQGINKWVGIQKLLDNLGLEPRNVMAIGDGLNDLELVRNSGFGVAMANAVPQVLGVADAVSTSNDEDGVAEAIDQYLRSTGKCDAGENEAPC